MVSAAKVNEDRRLIPQNGVNQFHLGLDVKQLESSIYGSITVAGDVGVDIKKEY